MNNEEELKELIRQNGHLLFENDKLMVINSQLMEQIKMLQHIIENILNKKGDKDE